MSSSFLLHQEFIKGLQSRGLPNLLLSSDELTRDQFNTRKMIVVATETGKVHIHVYYSCTHWPTEIHVHVYIYIQI